VWHVGAVYIAIMLTGVVFLLRGRETTRVRGRRILALTAGFAGAAAVSLAVSGTRPTPGAVGFWTLSLACALAFGRRWILVHHDPRNTADVLEAAMRMLRIPFEPAGPGYALKIDKGPAVLSVRQVLPRIALLSWTALGDPAKIELLLALLAKRFRPVFPRPTIDLR
jgi:hypothetical protein